ncbi:MAG: cupredoxin domain-containing protein [Acidobacteriota bacterium]
MSAKYFWWTCLFASIVVVALTASTWGLDPDQPSSARQSVRVVAERFSFTPSEIKVKRNVPLELELISEDTFHGFRISAAHLNVTIPARGRGSVKIRFEASEAGTYVFECSRPCGAGHTMMRGAIIVD